MIRFLFIVEVPNAGNMRDMTSTFCPSDSFLLRFKGPEDVLRMVFDNIVVNRTPLSASFGARFNVNSLHPSLG